MSALESINLWTLLVDNLVGGFFLTVLLLAILLFLIMGVFGRMSRMSVIYYIMLFMMVMGYSYGYRIISIFITLAIFIWVYLQYKGYLGG